MLRATGILQCTVLAVLLQAVQPFEIPSFYHKTSHVLEQFKNASSGLPAYARYQDIPDPGSSEQSLPLVTITDFATGEAGKETILLIGGEHARELITSEILLWLGLVLTGQDHGFSKWPASVEVATQRKAIGLGRSSLAKWVQGLLLKVVFKIVPVENIQGRKAVEQGNLCLRKTSGGVDLNRNWPVAWQQEATDSDEYGGTAPFSEAEARIIKLIAEGSPLRSFVNLHSGEFALYAPWDSQQKLAVGQPADIEGVLEQLNMWCQCMHGAAGAVAGYLAYGTSMDYMHAEMHVPYALTWEVYGPAGLGKLASGGRPQRLLQAVRLRVRWCFAHGDGLTYRDRLLQVGDSLPDPVAAEVEVAADVAGSGGAAVDASTTGAAETAGDGLQQAGAAASQSRMAGPQCFHAYNPSTLEDYQQVVATWVVSVLTLADHLASHPVASTASHTAEQDQQPQPRRPQDKKELAQELGTDEEQTLLDSAHTSIIKAARRGKADPQHMSNASINDARKSFQSGLERVTGVPVAMRGAAVAGTAWQLSIWPWWKVLLPVACVGMVLLAVWRKAGSPSLFERKRRRANDRFVV